MTQPRVIFFTVRSAQEKVERLTATAQSYFEKKEPFLILVDDEKAEQYLDDLLWRYPSFSFLPHSLGKEDRVTISREKKNLNHAKFVFNLCSTPLLMEGPFQIIYDYEDLSFPGKTQLFSLRFEAYKKAHFLIESRN